MNADIQPIKTLDPPSLGQARAPFGLQALQALLELAPDGIIVTDYQGICTYVNAAACEMLGYRRDEFVGQSIADFVRAEDVSRLMQSRAAMLRGRTGPDEWALRCKDGSWLPVEINARMLPDGQIQGFVRDISARKAQQADLERAARDSERLLKTVIEKQQASESLLRTVFELLPVGLWVADAEGNLVLGNPAGKRIWGGIPAVGPDRYTNYQGWWVETGRAIAPDEWGLARAIGRGETTRREMIRIKCLDGSFKTIINWATPIRGEAGEIIGAIAVNEDVTVLHQTQEQLRAAVRDREHILAVVAHDLRTPLSGIALKAAYAQRVAQAIAGAGKLDATAASIAEMTRAMAGLVDDLLAISTARSGRSMINFVPVAAAEVLAKATEAAQPLLAQAGLRLEVMPYGELPTIHIDRNRILRVFANLFDNALKFTDAGGHIVVRAEPSQGAVQFCVSNSGPALREQDRERLFQPFWQAGSEDRRGAGLGLSICGSIVEAHGGSIWTEPAEGMRVKICFVLPCVRPAPAGLGAQDG